MANFTNSEDSHIKTSRLTRRQKQNYKDFVPNFHNFEDNYMKKSRIPRVNKNKKHLPDSLDCNCIETEDVRNKKRIRSSSVETRSSGSSSGSSVDSMPEITPENAKYFFAVPKGFEPPAPTSLPPPPTDWF